MAEEVSFIRCPFCNAPWSEQNMKFWDLDAADECESGRFGPETVSISMTCHACNRLMYRKEGRELR